MKLTFDIVHPNITYHHRSEVPFCHSLNQKIFHVQRSPFFSTGIWQIG